MDTLIGKRISELAKADEISANTRFLVTRFDQVAKEIVESYGLKYSTLSNQIFNDVKNMLHLSSMAYESKYAYAKITHLHDYDYVDAEVFYGPDSERKYLDHKMIDLGTIEISNYNSVKSLHICVPYIRFEPPKKYRIGELKLVYISSDNVDYELKQKGYTPTYGWVIPDGRTYSKEDYPEAYELYKDDTSDTSFTIPEITGFFRLNPGINTTEPLKKYNYYNSDVKHIHEIHQKAQLGHVDVSAQFNLTSTSYAGPDLAAHSGGGAESDYPGGEGSVTTGQIDIAKDVKGGVVTVTGAKIYECDSDDTEAYPTHDTLVAVMYIGIRGQGNHLSVTSDTNGGTSSSPNKREVSSGYPIGTLPKPNKANHVFIGWTTRADGGDQVDKDTIITENMTIYAQYLPKTITFKKHGSLNISQNDVISDIKRDGYLLADQGIPITNGMEIVFKINCPKNNTSRGQITTLFNSKDKMQIGIANRKVYWGAKNNSLEDWPTLLGSVSVGLSRDYWIKMKQIGNKYIGYVSTDGINYTQDYEISKDNTNLKSYSFYIGNLPPSSNTSSNFSFNGSIDISQSYISINDTRIGFQINE